MRRVRMVLVFAAAVCAFGAFTASAFAKPPKEKLYYGEFIASAYGKTFSEATPGKVKGTGEVESPEKHGETFKLGPYDIQCLHTFKVEGEVFAARSPNFYATIKFSDCEAEKQLANKGRSLSPIKFSAPLHLEYHANGSVETDAEPNVEISKAVEDFKVSGEVCQVEILPQTLPIKAVKQPEPEEPYTAAVFERETEEVIGGPKKKAEFPENPLTGLSEGEQEYLIIENDFTKIKTTYEASKRCTKPGQSEEERKKLEEEKKPNPVEEKNGIFKATLNVKMHGGDIGFEEP